jgi:hypothetical protein
MLLMPVITFRDNSRRIEVNEFLISMFDLYINAQLLASPESTPSLKNGRIRSASWFLKLSKSVLIFLARLTGRLALVATSHCIRPAVLGALLPFLWPIHVLIGYPQGGSHKLISSNPHSLIF